VLVIGDTGVGKSTILSLMAGRNLVVKHNGLNTVIDSVDSSSTLKIGHEKYSQTSIPTKVVIGNSDFFDCSGFRDNRGDEF
jgi:ABC-type nitrate/sulfonate/bicarbonate transport system ATPase subunit